MDYNPLHDMSDDEAALARKDPVGYAKNVNGEKSQRDIDIDKEDRSLMESENASEIN